MAVLRRDSWESTGLLHSCSPTSRGSDTKACHFQIECLGLEPDLSLCESRRHMDDEEVSEVWV